MTKRTLLAILFFFGSVLILTRLDFNRNFTQYNYELQFDYGWYVEYSLLFSALYQLVIIPLTLWTHNFYFLLATEAFVLSNTPDLIYFGLWQGNFPTGHWTWMWFYEIFGYWTTTLQIIISLAINLSMLSIIIFHSFKKTQIT